MLVEQVLVEAICFKGAVAELACDHAAALQHFLSNSQLSLLKYVHL